MARVLTVDGSLANQGVKLVTAARAPVSAQVQEISELPAGSVPGQLLQWNGTDWVPFGDGAALGQIILWDGSAWVVGNAPAASGGLVAVTRYVDGDSGTHVPNAATSNYWVYLRGRGGLGGNVSSVNGGDVGAGGGGQGGEQVVFVPTNEEFTFACASGAAFTTSTTLNQQNAAGGGDAPAATDTAGLEAQLGGVGGEGDNIVSPFTFSTTRGSPGQVGVTDGSFGAFSVGVSGSGGGIGGGQGRTTLGNGEAGDNGGGGAGGFCVGPGTSATGGAGGGSSMEVWEYS